MHLHAGQLAALETLRGAGDLSFELLASGAGIDENGDQHIQGDWRIYVSRSDWIEKLRDAGARNVMLLEVPLPLESVSEEWRDLAAELRQAEQQYRNGDYHSCIGSCRTVMEELGRQRHWDENWANATLVGLADRKSRTEMNSSQREAALCAALRHYTHPAHHCPSEGREPRYTRAEAQYILSLTAVAVAHAQAG